MFGHLETNFNILCADLIYPCAISDLEFLFQSTFPPRSDVFYSFNEKFFIISGM